MTEPRRLKHGGGAAQRLLDSASLDRAGATSRERIQAMVSTSSAFSQTAADAKPRAREVSTIARWAVIAAAATFALAFGVSQWLSPRVTASSGVNASKSMSDFEPGSRPGRELEITPEPQRLLVEPWVALPSAESASADELRDFEAARNAVGERSPARALQLLDRFDGKYPQRSLAIEASVLRVQALELAGEHSTAVALARLLIANPAAASFKDRLGELLH